MNKVIGVLTSGGDGPGMNAAVRAVVRTGITLGFEMIGIRRGYEGLINGWFEPLELGSVGNMIKQGGTFLQTARSRRFRTEEGMQTAYEHMRARGIDALVVVGGDGSFRGLHEMIIKYGIVGIGIPGTIDNDLYGTEYTIGYDTALNTALECIDKIRDTADSHDRLFIVEVMGRHAGYIAMNTGIASGSEGVFIPENQNEYIHILERLKKGKCRGKKSFILIVSEGDEEGGAFAVRDKLVKDLDPSWDIRVTILGHVQRGGNPSAIDRIVASRLGYEAVLAINNGLSDIMIGYKGMNDPVTHIPLKDTWEKKKPIDDNILDMFEKLSQ